MRWQYRVVNIFAFQRFDGQVVKFFIVMRGNPLFGIQVHPRSLAESTESLEIPNLTTNISAKPRILHQNRLIVQ